MLLGLKIRDFTLFKLKYYLIFIDNSQKYMIIKYSKRRLYLYLSTVCLYGEKTIKINSKFSLNCLIQGFDSDIARLTKP